MRSEFQKRVLIVFPFNLSRDRNNPFVILLEEHLQKRGIQVCIVTSRLPALIRACFRFRPGAIHIHWLEGFRLRSSVRSSLHYFGTFCFLAAARAVGVRLVYTVHNLTPHQDHFPKVSKWANWFAARLVHTLIAMTEDTKKIVSAHFGVSQSKVIVIPHGHYATVHQSFPQQELARRDLGIPAGVFVFCLFGTYRSNKGLEIFLSTFKEIGLQDAVVIAHGRVAQHLKSQNLESTSLILFLDTNSELLTNVIRASDICVFPYLNVLHSGALHLAMTLGRGFVAPLEGTFLSLANQPYAFLYDSSDTHGLRSQLEAAYRSKESLEQRGEQGRRHALSTSWNMIAEQHDRAYFGFASGP